MVQWRTKNDHIPLENVFLDISYSLCYMVNYKNIEFEDAAIRYTFIEHS